MSGFANRGPQDNTATSAYPVGPQLFDPAIAVAGGGLTYANNLTARAGGARATATRLTAAVNRIAVCATAGDSVALPPAVGGQTMYIYNNGVASVQVYANPATTDLINTSPDFIGAGLAAGKTAAFVSSAVGQWFMILSA